LLNGQQFTSFTYRAFFLRAEYDKPIDTIEDVVKSGLTIQVLVLIYLKLTSMIAVKGQSPKLIFPRPRLLPAAGYSPTSAHPAASGRSWQVTAALLLFSLTSFPVSFRARLRHFRISGYNSLLTSCIKELSKIINYLR
jgi:hypothetical protein